MHITFFYLPWNDHWLDTCAQKSFFNLVLNKFLTSFRFTHGNLNWNIKLIWQVLICSWYLKCDKLNDLKKECFVKKRNFAFIFLQCMAAEFYISSESVAAFSSKCVLLLHALHQFMDREFCFSIGGFFLHCILYMAYSSCILWPACYGVLFWVFYVFHRDKIQFQHQNVYLVTNVDHIFIYCQSVRVKFMVKRGSFNYFRLNFLTPVEVSIWSKQNEVVTILFLFNVSEQSKTRFLHVIF